jgi:hypothetical protein
MPESLPPSKVPQPSRVTPATCLAVPDDTILIPPANPLTKSMCLIRRISGSVVEVFHGCPGVESEKKKTYGMSVC